MVSVTTEVNVDIDLADIEDDIIYHLENNGYRVIAGDEKDIVDQIHNLYRDYVSYAVNENFERKLKTFFEDQLNILVK